MWIIIIYLEKFATLTLSTAPAFWNDAIGKQGYSTSSQLDPRLSRSTTIITRSQKDQPWWELWALVAVRLRYQQCNAKYFLLLLLETQAAQSKKMSAFFERSLRCGVGQVWEYPMDIANTLELHFTRNKFPRRATVDGIRWIKLVVWSS